MIRCIIVDDEPQARKTLEECIQKTPQLRLLGSFDSALQAWEFLKTTPVDLFFSDILMPDIDGISLLKHLRNPPLLIFVTGNSEHAAEGFNLDIIDYVVKPFDYARFLKAVHKAEIFLSRAEGNDQKKEFLVVKDGHKNIVLRFTEIFFIQGNGEYVTVVTEEKDHLIHTTMKQMEAHLPSNHFIRAQKSYIINIGFIREVTPTKIIMKGSIKDIPLGLQYREKLYKQLGIH